MLHKLLDPAVIKFRAHQAGTKKFSPKVRFSIDTDRYIIKTAESDDELEEVLRLRYEVFIREGLKKKIPLRVDVDRFDFLADHLLIIEKAQSKVVGTYRLISSLFSSQFYSETEFKMDPLLELPGAKLELGRACTAKDFRSGMAIALLWRGIAKYLYETQSVYLFGCASVKMTDPVAIARLTRYLELQQHLQKIDGVQPTEKFEVKGIHRLMGDLQVDPLDESLQDEVPSLLKSYFKVGAKIVSDPALDLDFKCIDFLTVLDTREMTSAYEKKYLPC